MTPADLFTPNPPHWGLRGDPYLWAEMRDLLSDRPWPPTAEHLRTLLAEAFETLTDHPLTTTKNFYIERFAYGGMSSGHIAPGYWREIAIPLLIDRYTQTESS